MFATAKFLENLWRWKEKLRASCSGSEPERCSVPRHCFRKAFLHISLLHSSCFSGEEKSRGVCRCISAEWAHALCNLNERCISGLQGLDSEKQQLNPDPLDLPSGSNHVTAPHELWIFLVAKPCFQVILAAFFIAMLLLQPALNNPIAGKRIALLQR